METKYTVKIWQLIRGKERIIDIQTFETREAANKFIEEHKAPCRPYKMKPDTLYHEMEGNV